MGMSDPFNPAVMSMCKFHVKAEKQLTEKIHHFYPAVHPKYPGVYQGPVT